MLNETNFFHNPARNVFFVMSRFQVFPEIHEFEYNQKKTGSVTLSRFQILPEIQEFNTTRCVTFRDSFVFWGHEQWIQVLQNHKELDLSVHWLTNVTNCKQTFIGNRRDSYICTYIRKSND